MTMIDECFSRRMDVLHERFPLREFRREFVEQFANHGLVLIQGTPVEYVGISVMRVDDRNGFIFAKQRYIDTALRLARRWGFDVERREHRGWGDKDLHAYAVTIPHGYLRNRMSREAIGRMHTRDRSSMHRQTEEAKEYIRKESLVI